jgi:predicted nucleotidyltransferase
MIDEAKIAEAGRRIGAAAPEGSRVILFGSQARGEANSHSDVDILVIEPEVENATEEAVRLYRTLKDLRIPVDVLVIDEAKARRRAKVKGTVVERALREGRDLGTQPDGQKFALLLMRGSRGFPTPQIPDCRPLSL